MVKGLLFRNVESDDRHAQYNVHLLPLRYEERAQKLQEPRDETGDPSVLARQARQAQRSVGASGGALGCAPSLSADVGAADQYDNGGRAPRDLPHEGHEEASD